MTTRSGVRRRPLRGLVGGFLLGLSAALLLFVYGIVPMSLLWLGVCVLVGMLLGILLAYVVPPRRVSAPGVRTG